jgi:hypothetical protein
MFAVFDEIGTGFFEQEGYLFLFANTTKFKNPVKVALAGFVSGFAACYNLFHSLR